VEPLLNLPTRYFFDSIRMKVMRVALLAGGAAMLAVAGCASTPQATFENDAEAKTFVTHPATAAIYVYRDPLDRRDSDSVLYVDRRLIGATLPGGFFRIEARPGKRVLHGLAYDRGALEIDVRPGETYFISLSVVEGTSNFTPKSAAVGRAELLACCVLLENWTPGQRPLLR
jgi:hypothetical protein